MAARCFSPFLTSAARPFSSRAVGGADRGAGSGQWGRHTPRVGPPGARPTGFVAMVAGGAKPSLWILLLLGIAADLPPAEAQETPCAEDDDKQAHRDFPNIGASSCAGILAAGQCSQVAGHGVCDCSCPLAAVEPAAEPAGPQPQPPTACASGQPASGSLLPDDTACCDVPGWTDDAGNNCSAYIAQGWCCTAGVNEGCNSQYALPGGVDSDHGCCRSCAEYVPPEPEPALPAPDGCVDDDAAMQAATAGQGDFTCAGIIVAGACSQVASLGICTCSCPMTSPPPTTCASGQPSSGSLLAVDATCCDVPGELPPRWPHEYASILRAA